MASDQVENGTVCHQLMTYIAMSWIRGHMTSVLYFTGKMILFGITLAFVLLPAAIIMFMDISWVYMDYRNIEEDESRDDKISKTYVVARCLISFFSLGLLGRLWR